MRAAVYSLGRRFWLLRFAWLVRVFALASLVDAAWLVPAVALAQSRRSGGCFIWKWSMARACSFPKAETGPQDCCVDVWRACVGVVGIGVVSSFCLTVRSIFVVLYQYVSFRVSLPSSSTYSTRVPDCMCVLNTIAVKYSVS